MPYEIEEEKTHNEAIAPSFDRPIQDVGLLVLRGPDAGSRFVVKPPGGVIGREPGAAVQVRDPNVSRRHAIIEFGDGRVLLNDLGSRNGVYVNGVQVARAEIYDGNDVQISNDTVMRVRFQDATETELLEELHGSAMKDSLTGLPNRRYVIDRLRQELAFAYRHGEPLSVALIDIDDFKKVLDVDGQRGGDLLLEAVAEVVRKASRVEDVVARYGHDELVAVLRATNIKQARDYAERVAEAVRARAYRTGDVPVRATVTIGVSSFVGPKKRRRGRALTGQPPKKQEPQPPVDPTAATTLLDQADQALYRGKHEGKNRVSVWDAD